MKTLIITSKTAWEHAIKVLGIGEDEKEAPKTYPILLQFDLFEPTTTEPNAVGSLVADNIQYIYLGQAAKFLSVASVLDLAVIPAATRALIRDKLNTLSPVKDKLPSEYKIGDQITTLDGLEAIIVAIGTSGNTTSLTATDPITGVEGIIEVKEEDSSFSGAVSGLNNLPVDAAKLDSKPHIAEEVDDKEHVLDVERDV